MEWKQIYYFFYITATYYTSDTEQIQIITFPNGNKWDCTKIGIIVAIAVIHHRTPCLNINYGVTGYGYISSLSFLGLNNLNRFFPPTRGIKCYFYSQFVGHHEATDDLNGWEVLSAQPPPPKKKSPTNLLCVRNVQCVISQRYFKKNHTKCWQHSLIFRHV